MKRTLLAIDPGLDVTGIAIFDLETWFGPDAGPSGLHHALRSLIGTQEITTLTDDPVGRRLATIMDDIIGTVHDYAVAVAYLEQPAYEGDYYGVERRSSVNRLYEARGAILAALGACGVPTFQPRAGTSTKSERAELLDQALGGMGRRLPRGVRGGRMEDVWDAIWVGCWALTTSLAIDLPQLKTSAETAVSTGTS